MLALLILQNVVLAVDELGVVLQLFAVIGLFRLFELYLATCFGQHVFLVLLQSYFVLSAGLVVV